MLLTSNGRVRIGSLGIPEVFAEPAGLQDTAQLHREDLSALGHLLLVLACVGRGASPSLDYLTAHFSRDFCHAVAGLLASAEGEPWRTVGGGVAGGRGRQGTSGALEGGRCCVAVRFRHWLWCAAPHTLHAWLGGFLSGCRQRVCELAPAAGRAGRPTPGGARLDLALQVQLVPQASPILLPCFFFIYFRCRDIPCAPLPAPLSVLVQMAQLSYSRHPPPTLTPIPHPACLLAFLPPCLPALQRCTAGRGAA